ncbi:MAG: thioredoxin [Halieaceae bacterium]|nr:thioredoxin [Halieaceae bacterium]
MDEVRPDVVVDIDENNASQLLIEESHNRLVVVDFWAEWCEPCKTLMPILEKIAAEYEGAFLLARVNADDQQMIAQQFGVRSLPTVMLILEGKPVDGFAGAQSESVVRQLLEKHLPPPWESLLLEARSVAESDDSTKAISLYRQVWETSEQAIKVGIEYAQVLVDCMRLDDAENVLETVPKIDQDASYDQVFAQIKIKREASRSPELEALEQDLEKDPQNNEVKVKLAVQYTGVGQYREALELLMAVLEKDINHDDGTTKKMLLDTITSLGKADPLAAEFQRKLFSLLY